MSDTAAATTTPTGAAEPKCATTTTGENIASFSTSHYPDGVNSNFLKGGADELGAKYAGEKGLFTNPETRDIAGNVEDIMAELAALGFDKGSTTAAADGGGLKGKNVADIGAGTGLFLPSLNEAVGSEGHVYAVEISDGFLELLVNQKDRDGLDQVIVIKGTVTDANLPTDVKMDLVLLIDVYHHIEYPLTYMQKLRSCMKPGGALVVIDFHRVSFH